MGDNVRFSLVVAVDDAAGYGTLIYYWLKNKSKTQLQLMGLLSLLPVGADIFVVGENRNGVRNVKQMSADYAPSGKVNSARHCGPYFGRLKKQPIFDADKFWGEYSVDGLTVKTLSGIFSCDGLDVGSQLLFSTLTPHTKGKVLDIGCGVGMLSVVFVRHSSKIRLALCDVSAPAVKVGHATLATSGVEGEVLAGNVFSEVKGRFDMIISSPPLHDGMQASLDAAQMLIHSATCHLDSGSELRIVANAFLPYPDVLDGTLGLHEVIAQTGHFKVCRATIARQAKKGQLSHRIPCRMRHERLIRSARSACQPFVGQIRRTSVASGIYPRMPTEPVHQLPDGRFSSDCTSDDN